MCLLVCVLITSVMVLLELNCEKLEFHLNRTYGKRWAWKLRTESSVASTQLTVCGTALSEGNPGEPGNVFRGWVTERWHPEQACNTGNSAFAPDPGTLVCWLLVAHWNNGRILPLERGTPSRRGYFSFVLNWFGWGNILVRMDVCHFCVLFVEVLIVSLFSYPEERGWKW